MTHTVRLAAFSLFSLSSMAPALPAVAASMDAPVAAATAPAVAPAPMSGDFTILVGGDLLGPYRTSLDMVPERMRPVVDLIRKSDATFANQEGNSFDLTTFSGAMAAENGGGYPLQPLETMRALKGLGINLVSRANNHSLDWGEQGLRDSDFALTAIGITHAGTGQSLVEARKASILNTGHGTVALIATASTFPGMAPAGDPGRGAGPRPGLNPLHVEPVFNVSASEMKALADIARRGGWQGYDVPPAGEPVHEVHLNDTLYRVSDKPGLSYDVSEVDRKALLGAVTDAAKRANLVLFSIHAHETLSGAYEDPAPADFLPPLFHDAIDAGASVVVRHGPHATQGIEIYKGRPIFYGTGHFFFELPRTLTIPSAGPNKQTVTFPDNWWDSTLASLHYVNGKLKQIRVYPIELLSADGPDKGVPTLASGEKARAILGELARRSAAFGTSVRIEGETGVIDIPA
ncbi:MAG: CapA family protein [Sphingobium sp.]